MSGHLFIHYKALVLLYHTSYSQYHYHTNDLSTFCIRTSQDPGASEAAGGHARRAQRLRGQLHHAQPGLGGVHDQGEDGDGGEVVVPPYWNSSKPASREADK